MPFHEFKEASYGFIVRSISRLSLKLTDLISFQIIWFLTETKVLRKRSKTFQSPKVDLASGIGVNYFRLVNIESWIYRNSQKKESSCLSKSNRLWRISPEPFEPQKIYLRKRIVPNPKSCICNQRAGLQSLKGCRSHVHDTSFDTLEAKNGRLVATESVFKNPWEILFCFKID